MKLSTPPTTFSSAIRFAPSIGGQAAAQVWKVWAEGSEVYALNRSSNGIAKISIHESGQIHIHKESREKQLLSPALFLASGQWLHGLEIRFLLHPRALRPTQKLKPRLKVLLLETTYNQALVINILVGAPGCPGDAALPEEFDGGSLLWRVHLRNGRPAILIARMLPLDDQNREALRNIWEVVPLKVNFDKKPEGFYGEVKDVRWSPQGGNVLFVVPLGMEIVRFPGDRAQSASAVTEVPVSVTTPTVTKEITAPNGAAVATLSFGGITSVATLKRDEQIAVALGTMTLKINPDLLIAGSEFGTQPVYLSCVPTINGASPRHWAYTVVSRFDGENFVSEIRPMSVGLGQPHHTDELMGILETDEIVMATPSLKLEVSMSAPVSTLQLVAQLLLREF